MRFAFCAPISTTTSLLLLMVVTQTTGFVFPSAVSHLAIEYHQQQNVAATTVTTKIYAKDRDTWERDIDDSVMRKIQRDPKKVNSLGETAAGAVLGGLLLGPFGALFGASIGSNMGAKNSVNRLRQEEMEKMGLTPDILDMAQSVGLALEQGIAGLEATKDSLETQQRLARRIDSDEKDLYEKAMMAMKDGDEDTARAVLLKRTQLQDQLKSVLINCAQEKDRLAKMETNVAELKRRALEVESLVKRTVSSKSLQSTSQFSLPVEDPLLQKFRDMGID